MDGHSQQEHIHIQSRTNTLHAFPLVQHGLTRSLRFVAFRLHHFKEKLSERTTMKILYIEKFISHRSRHTKESMHHQFFTINLPKGYSHF